ncbi:P-loop containing nucleoside triphosphate hydrolase protein [Xylariaceae sp. FL0255]|nr:P-loop containing nucleoside triphosphate hydrolase protein [Xylariaceae sp. FL0255]
MTNPLPSVPSYLQIHAINYENKSRLRLQSQAMFSLLGHPSLTDLQLAEIEANILRQHISRLLVPRLSGNEKVQQVLLNLKQATDLILSNQTILDIRPRSLSDIETSAGEASTRQDSDIANPALSPSPGELSDVSESFEAQLGALVDAYHPVAPTQETLERDGPELNLPSPHFATLKEDPWSDDVDQALRDRFRMTRFRHNQREAIDATLAGKDALVLMPTGSGKSLCYQLPALIQSGKTRGVTLVVSPLLSLIYDQLEHLKALGIPATTLNSETPPEDRRRILASLRRDPSISMLYVTPEMINKSSIFQICLEELYQDQKLARLVVDEAHCVSQWGHDFRPDYKQLGNFRAKFPLVPLLALTATATSNTIADVKSNLGVTACQTFSQSFDRPNLYYADQTGIVYTLSRKSAETIAKSLRDDHGIAAYHYHALVPAGDKVEIQNAWQEGKIKVVVATIAFGMGIDKADVRFVIHQSVPKSLEGYYQETGRAGRDGKASDCHLYFSYSDVAVLRKMIDEGDGSQRLKKRQGALLEKVITFCINRTSCRRLELLRYFGEAFPRSRCDAACDNCRANIAKETTDYTEYALAILHLVRLYGRLTSSQCVKFLLGKETQLRGKGLEYYGMARRLAKRDMQRIVNDLQAGGALKEHNIINPADRMAIPCLQLGPGADTFFAGTQKLFLERERRVRFASPETYGNEASDEEGEISRYFVRNTTLREIPASASKYFVPSQRV